MFLSKLELHGFKSFPYRTELRFEPGITAVVGPNGCGKTNLLDAVRWVLGEQRVALLRGTKMEQVIFNGTSALKPLGMAEVTVTITNEDGRLQTEFKQVAVTRRLHRSGESEYLLNRLPCRLRDIVDLFLNTGMGTHAYSVIQPQMIEAILSDRAEERRSLFEEAAGITKYKRRRREASSRLESTEADLVRIQDLYSEVEKQYNSLKRQASKAKRFQKLKETQRELETKIAGQQLLQLLRDKDERTTEARHLENRLAKLSTNIAGNSAELERLQDHSSTLEERLQQLSKSLTEVVAKSYEIEKRNSADQERIAQSENLKDKCQLELENIQTRRTELLERLQEQNKQIRQMAERLEDKRSRHQQASAKLQELEEALIQARKGLDTQRGKRQELSGQLSQLRTEAKLVEERLRELDDTLSRLRQTDLGLTEQESSSTQKVASLTGSLKVEEKLCSTVEEEFKRNRAELASLQERIQETTEKLHSAEREQGELRARKESVESIVLGYQDYDQTTQEILSRKEHFAGVIDSVANLITVKSRFTTAIESALGRAASYLVCRDTESALRVVNFIKENGSGQACFLPLDRIGSKDFGSHIPVARGDEILGWASDLVEVESQYASLSKLLLGNVLVVSDFDTALKTSEDLPGGYRAVTLEGEQVLSGGALTAGRLSSQKKGQLSRKSELELLASRLSEIDPEIEQTREAFRSLHHKRDRLQQKLASQEERIRVHRERIAALERDRSAAEYRLSHVGESLASNRREEEELREKRSQLLERQEELGSILRELERDSVQRGRALESESTDLESLEREHRSQTTQVNRLLVEVMNLESGLQNMKANLATTRELVAQLQTAEERWRRELKAAEQASQSAKRSMTENLRRLDQISQQRARMEAQRLNLTSERSLILSQISELEKKKKSTRVERENLKERLHQLNLELVEIDGKARGIKDKIWEEYSLRLEEEITEPPTERVDLEAMRQELESLKAKLSSIGPVNLLALEDFRGVSDRLEFLTKQRRDLTEAKTQLRQAIAKINRTAKERFQESFEYARRNFDRVFSELFEGGETRLRLSDPADPLESPIEISVRPRGKRFIPLAQLSGGERALTAISLIFAIYLIKPSPFCILDEIDAPLDDANTERFLKMIKRFSRHTQFIIITHNKLTMEAADVLYGITMEEPGISKVVSVRLGRPEEVSAEVA